MVFRGLQKADHMVKEIRFKGVNVTLEGDYSNRVATFRHFTEPKKRKRPQTKIPGRGRVATNWGQIIDVELKINEPYWAKFREGLSPADLRGLSDELGQAHMELIQAIHRNRGMFDAKQISDYLTGKWDPGGLVGKAVGACGALRIPFQCVASTPVLPNLGYSKAVEDFRNMDLGLPKFDGFGPLADYFLKDGGTAAVLTAGPESLVEARNRANNNRIIVQISGAYGNRLVRYVRGDDFVIQARHERERSRRDLDDDEFIFSNRYHLFAEEKPVYVEGNYSTLMREICRSSALVSARHPLVPTKRDWR